MIGRLALCGFTLAWLGCDGGDPEVEPPKVLTLGEAVSQYREAMVISVDRENGQLVLDYNPFGGGCFTLRPGPTGTVNGAPMTLLSAGDGFVKDEPDEDLCARPKWGFAARDAGEPETTFELSDSSTTLTADFIELMADRSLSTPDASVVAGSTLEIQWSPPDDNLFWDPQNSDAPRVTLSPVDGGPGADFVSLSPGKTPGSFAFTVPNSPTGAVELGLTGAIELGFKQCTITCRAHEAIGYLQPINPHLELNIQP